MPVAIACPRCGKTLRFADADAGQRVLCIACGQALVVPAAEPPADQISWMTQSPAGPAASPAPTSIKPPTSRMVWIGFGLGAACSVIVGLVVLAVVSRQPQEQSHNQASAQQRQPPATLPSSTPISATSPLAVTSDDGSKTVGPVVVQQQSIASPLTAPTTEASADQPLPPATSQPAPEAGSRLFALPESRPATQPQDLSTPPPATQPQVASAPEATLAPEPSMLPQTQPESASAMTQPQQWKLKRPPIQPVPLPQQTLTDEMIGESIQRGVNWMLSRYSAETYKVKAISHTSSVGAVELPVTEGINALCVYSLIESGRVINDPRITAHAAMLARLIDAMKKTRRDIHGGLSPETYTIALRSAALAVYARPEDRQTLLDDANYLIQSGHNGHYSYHLPMSLGEVFDNSNSQYGLMGVWAAADAGVDVPHAYWQAAEKHWTSQQLPNGRWQYRPITVERRDVGFKRPQQTTGALAMTEAGIASLLVAKDFADIPTFHGEVGRDPFSPELHKAFHYWETGDNSVTWDASDNVGSGVPPTTGYWLFGVARIGLASGFKYFGTHDWYRELAAKVILDQNADGSWMSMHSDAFGDPNDRYIDTAYALMFLSRGRPPIMMNKLRLEHLSGADVNNRYWDNRPRDLAHLTGWTSRQLERPVNWQIVNLWRDWWDWLDSPVLYFASHRPLNFTDRDYENIRSFARAGGVIYTQADGDDPSYDRFVKDFTKKLFPEYELKDIPGDHPLYSANYRLFGRPQVKGISNGARLLLVYSPKDMARYWHVRDFTVHRYAFELGLNIFVYAGGKRELRNRIDSPYIPQPVSKPVTTVDIARIKYEGNWDPEPYAYTRFRRLLQTNTGYDASTQAVTWRQLLATKAPICHITGTERYDLTTEEVGILKQYVEDGGVLLIDVCGGSKPFADSMGRVLFRAFPQQSLKVLPRYHPLLNATQPGMFDISKRRTRSYVSEKLNDAAGRLEIMAIGKGHVIFTDFDLTSGLLGVDTWGIYGYAPDYCSKFLQNLIMWTLDGQVEEEK